MQRRQRRRSTFLPSGPLPHAEAGASPDLETLGVPSLLCTRVSFELCAYNLASDNVQYGKGFQVFPKSLSAAKNPRAPHTRFRLAVPAAGQPSNTWHLITVLERRSHKMWEQSPVPKARGNRPPWLPISSVANATTIAGPGLGATHT